MMTQEIATSSNGQIAEWSLALAPLKHLNQSQLDALIERIDAFISNEINEIEENK